MSATPLLDRLQGVRRYGGGWRANCPNGHEKTRGSLSITEGEDGRLLVTCFACHDTPAILAAVGLEMADLFPERIKDPSPQARSAAREAFRRNGWQAALGVLVREATVVLCAAGMLRQRQPFTDEDDQRLALAMQRIERAREVLHAR